MVPRPGIWEPLEENICNGATSADSASTMWTLEAEVLLEGPEGERTVPVMEFYTGPGRTVRDRCEVCKGFLIRKEHLDGWCGHYMKYGKRNAMEIATLGCAVRVKLSEDRTVIEGCAFELWSGRTDSAAMFPGRGRTAGTSCG